MADSADPNNEAARLAALDRYEILDTPCEQRFDDFTTLAAQICETPISLISLVDERRQWFKSKVGVEVSETPRESAFCAHTFSNPSELLVVPDATADQRFVNNPLVTGDPLIRFYAGAPLVTPEGLPLGTLCVIDRQPRQLSDRQLETLKTLARHVVTEIEARQNLRLLEQTARDLEFQRQETQLILDHVPAYVYYKDTHNTILRVNQPVAESLGLEVADIEGRPSAEIYPDQAEEYFKDDLEILRCGKPKLGIVEPLDTGDGSLHWVNTDKIPIFTAAGKIERLLVICSDITQLKETEQSLLESQTLLSDANARLEERVEQKTAELAASQQLYEDLYQNSPDMYVSIDPSSTLVMQCNQTLLHETGYSAEEVIGHSVFDFYHPSSLEAAQAAMHQFRSTGSVHNFELTLVRKDGTSIEVSLNVSSSRDSQGKILSSRSVWRDITDKKQLEKEIKNSANQLAHLSRVATMNEMATGIAHELNQPLQAIKNYAQGAIIRLGNSSFDPNALASVLQDIVLDADRAATLIHSLRDFVKPSGKKTRVVAPAEIVSRVLKILAYELDQHQVTLSVMVDQDLPEITCDSVQIKQVLINLILNAAEASADLPVGERKVELQVQATQEQTIKFSVVDGGVGAKDIDRIFDAFYTTKTLGLGMGLAICRTVVEAHGGALIATSNVDRGLTMSFQLPCDRA